MKFYRQPLSEEFFYSSPEKLPRNSYRWILSGLTSPGRKPFGSKEVYSATKRRD
ncbi:MAG: hypothetical protein KZQ90_14380 [Candidatus Thiodiazotropha sp. (ex Codakia rugifera)]|nr:hypothetical protein [Candidatus Thiodiazotropha sp. (ex Codakia rugifera)]